MSPDSPLAPALDIPEEGPEVWGNYPDIKSVKDYRKSLLG